MPRAVWIILWTLVGAMAGVGAFILIVEGDVVSNHKMTQGIAMVFLGCPSAAILMACGLIIGLVWRPNNDHDTARRRDPAVIGAALGGVFSACLLVGFLSSRPLIWRFQDR